MHDYGEHTRVNDSMAIQPHTKPDKRCEGCTPAAPADPRLQDYTHIERRVLNDPVCITPSRTKNCGIKMCKDGCWPLRQGYRYTPDGWTFGPPHRGDTHEEPMAQYTQPY